MFTSPTSARMRCVHVASTAACEMSRFQGSSPGNTRHDPTIRSPRIGPPAPPAPTPPVELAPAPPVPHCPLHDDPLPPLPFALPLPTVPLPAVPLPLVPPLPFPDPAPGP